LVLFEIPNEAEVKVIWEEFPMGLKYKEWLQVYNHCVHEDYSFMFINFQKQKSQRIMKNFDQYITTAPDDDGDFDDEDDSLPKKRK
jgi:hypothetical protein